jgi:hypothetical protein
MAKLNGPFSFTGPLSGLSFYTRKDISGTFVREKSTLTKERVQTDPALEGTRRSGIEMGGRSLGAKWIRRTLYPLQAVRDGNWQGALTSALLPVQRRDSISLLGQRSLLLSQFGYLLEGFLLSQRTPWEGLVRTPFLYTLNKEAQSALVEVPELTHGVNFFPRTPHPFFQVIATLGPVPDLHHTPNGYAPDLTGGHHLPAVAHTGWLGVKQGSSPSMLELELPYAIEFPSYALVLAVGLVFGTLDERGEIKQLGYSGSGKILALG